MTRAYNTATTQQNSGGAVAGFVTGKNFVINGGFDIWQRGTSFTGTPYNAYVADRWVSGSDQTVAISRQTTGVPSGQRYCIRNAVTSGTGYVALYQTIETANVIPLQGKVVTLSVKLRRSSGYSGSMTLKVQKNNSVDISSGGWTDITGSSVIIANSSLPTGTTASDWYTATTTFTVPDDGTALTLRVAIEPNAGYTSSAYWEASSVQLEIGSVATPFTRSGGTIAGELAACQRYYWRFTAAAGGANYLCLGRTTSQVDVEIQHPVQMRTSPTALEYGGTLDVSDINVAGYNCSSLSFANASVLFASIRANTQASLAQGKTYVFGVQTNAYYGFSAEL